MRTTRATLLFEEQESLWNLAVATVKRHVSTGHGKRLVYRGVAIDRTGAQAITMTGRATPVIEVTRAGRIPVLV